MKTAGLSPYLLKLKVTKLQVNKSNLPVTFRSSARPISINLNSYIMKNLILTFLLLNFIGRIYAQELDSLKTIMDNKLGHEYSESGSNSQPAPTVDENGEEVNIKLMNKEVVKVIDSDDSTFVKVGDKGLIQVNDQPDSTRIRVGNKEISIVERGDNTEIKMDKVDVKQRYQNPKFRGHWAGFEFGINNLLDNAFTISREGDNLFMDINTGRSWAINLNFSQYSLGFGTSHFGAIIGLGLEFNNYFFDRANTIIEENDYVVEVDLSDTTGIAKSKLTSMFLRVPLIFEVQFPNVVRARRVFISAGLVTGLKLASHTKVVYKDDNGKNKDKNNDDFNISPFRYGLTTRIGFGNLSVFGDYYFTPLFIADKGPHLHPFTIGMAFNF
jgi:hypothetical protein